jgi:hypothetical protein
MHKFVWVLVVTVAGLAFGQDKPQPNGIDPEAFRAAQERLNAKAAERNAARAKVVTISQGELDDLKARVRDLENELRSLRGPATAPSAKAKPRNSIEPGMTREELERFVKSKLGALRINVVNVRMTLGHKHETLSIEKVAKVSRQVGTKVDFTGAQHDIYASAEEAQEVAKVILVDGVVTEVSGR